MWTGGLPHQSGLPHLPGVPQLFVSRPLVTLLSLVLYQLCFNQHSTNPRNHNNLARTQRKLIFPWPALDQPFIDRGYYMAA